MLWLRSSASMGDMHRPVCAHAAGSGKGAERGRLTAEMCVVSAAFLDSLQQQALAEARSAAEEALAARKASSAAASTSGTANGAVSPVCQARFSHPACGTASCGTAKSLLHSFRGSGGYPAPCAASW